MTIYDFEKKYSQYGGLARLTELRALLFSQEYIADEFKVSKERVRQWMKIFFGGDYDPREDRRESIKTGMIDFAKHNRIEEFDKAFKKSPYYKEVLLDLEKQKIYVNTK